MLTFNKSLNFNGDSQINGATIANFNASYNDGNLYFNKNIQKVEEYTDAEIEAQVNTDYDEFEKKVMAVIGESNVEKVTEETA